MLLTSPTLGVKAVKWLPLKHDRFVLVVMTRRLQWAADLVLRKWRCMAWVLMLMLAISLAIIPIPCRRPSILCADGVTVFLDRTFAVIRHSSGRNKRRAAPVTSAMLMGVLCSVPVVNSLLKLELMTMMRSSATFLPRPIA